jgi:hypothetical protein
MRQKMPGMRPRRIETPVERLRSTRSGFIAISVATPSRKVVQLSLLFCPLLLSTPAFAQEPRRARDAKPAEHDAERARQQKMAEDLRRAREADRIREAKREERERENQEPTMVALAPPRETHESKRLRAQREAEARREVRAADHARERERASARRVRAGRDAAP